MRIFITGISGLLGLNAALQLKDQYEISGVYLSHPVRIEGVETVRLDLSDACAVNDALAKFKPQMVLHTAGLTSVDACEMNSAEARRLHVQVSDHVARASSAVGAALVHVSTDHLFNGTKPVVAEEEPPSPLNQYARTKFEAEQVVKSLHPQALVVRTNFYGWGTAVRASFSDWILSALEQQKSLNMFTDVFFTPILVNDLVETIIQLVKADATGVYHVAGSERISKYAFAIELAKVFGYSTSQVRAATIEDASLRAKRPRDMSLNTQKVVRLLGKPMPTVAAGLKRLKELELKGWRQLLYKAVPSEAVMRSNAHVRQ